MSGRDPQAGFSMIEALIAMAVLAVGAVSLLGATEGHSARIGDLTDRTVARWVAEERLTAWRLGLPEIDETHTRAEVEMFGRAWRVTVEATPTTDAALDRLEIRVAPAEADGANVRLTGYIDTARDG
ncbi:MAG: general secretion pathway protein I [Limimaricola cinnabarinus]|jgi:general secretion pathway protein I|uniref:Type II secretion system protein I n=1 Tax=Limimaricola cinnabarinus LL-001 TaxID=1337093 RepID=U3ADH4_9RHOB|nr:type II secretion system minor pseudopilin GspI [Limimaricola cinnabarinus]GAD55729.1 general secretion pathway protein I [Limimaricola cinnabarinus LL-001]